ncbi:MAG: ATP phosphoribosyltransferase [Gemmatimonadetes bacterium]|nr:ATP phosphoribosyltransferase [Gemmatimonadota bacterium]
MIRIALPNKGRLAEGAREILERAGLEFDMAHERSLQASLGGEFEALFVRADDIPEFVADGAADVGITGRDLVEECGRELRVLLDLGFGRCRLAVAAREDDGIDAVAAIPAGTRVATAFPRLARRYFEAAGCDVVIVPVSGAAEVAPHLGVADIIVDLVSTGSTLKTNGLREVATVLESSALLVSRPAILDDPLAGRKVRELTVALESVVRAEGKRYLMANVRKDALATVKEILPGISGPTIVDVLDHGDWVAAHAVVDRRELYRVIAELKAIGATGILVTKIERLMP